MRKLQDHEIYVSQSGVVIATYERAGNVKTGSFALPEPTDAEVERRKRLS